MRPVFASTGKLHDSGHLVCKNPRTSSRGFQRFTKNEFRPTREESAKIRLIHKQPWTPRQIDMALWGLGKQLEDDGLLGTKKRPDALISMRKSSFFAACTATDS